MTDNLGLLTRIEKSLPYLEPFPNLTLASDWDVTNEIVTTLQAMKNRFLRMFTDIKMTTSHTATSRLKLS
jgi:hypothetical protein